MPLKDEPIVNASKQTIRELCILAFEGAKYLLKTDIKKLDDLKGFINLDDYCKHHIDSNDYDKFIEEFNEDLDADIWVSENIEEINKLAENINKAYKKYIKK